MLLNVLLHYVTAESYLHYNKGIFYKILSGLLHAAFGPRYNVLIIGHVLNSGLSLTYYKTTCACVSHVDKGKENVSAA